MMKRQVLLVTAGVVLVCALCSSAQPVLLPWGNVAGMRVGGEPVPFETSIRIIRSDWSGFTTTCKYIQRPRYSRDGSARVVNSRIESLSFEQRMEETAADTATLRLKLSAEADIEMAAACFCVELPAREFTGAKVQLIDPDGGAAAISLDGAPPSGQKDYVKVTASGVRIATPSRQLEARLGAPVEVIIRRDLPERPTALNDPKERQEFVTGPGAAEKADFQVYFVLIGGSAAKGQTAEATVTLKASAAPDVQPVNLALDPSRPGRAFDGIGGNFRLQFPRTDPAVIQYNLENLRVSWGRVAMPWREWDPQEDGDPLAAARAGRVHGNVLRAMEMARTLSRRKMPVIVSAWAPPRWAEAANQPPGLRGTALNPEKMDRVCKSLTDYLVFLKERFGVEAALVSFNEPEIGVEVRQTPAEHAEFVRMMGMQLVERGLATRLLLGDTAHCTPSAFDFIKPSLAEPLLHRYVGAIGFHTWRGCLEEELAKWAAAARQLNVPLLVTEGGPDAHLHEYPPIMLEPWFQLQEIEQYVRICAVGQPASIMEWQLTADYSVLWGGGVYGSDGPLRPTQRFWNLKQLGLTPPGAFALPLPADRPNITSAAFGDIAGGTFAIHIVNSGAGRPATLAGLPLGVKTMRVYLTDATRGMAEGDRVPVENGRAQFALPVAGYVTLIGTIEP